MALKSSVPMGVCRLAALVSLLAACGGELPGSPEDSPLADAAASPDAVASPDAPTPATTDTPPASTDAPTQGPSDRDAAPSDRPVAADAGTAGPSCASAPALSAPENSANAGYAFTLRGVVAQHSTTPQGCFWRAGYAVTARFVSPVSARWRLGARTQGIRYLGVLDGCREDAVGERLRCASTRVAPTSPLDPPSISTDITLRAGQSVTLVANCAEDSTGCTAELFAVRIEDRGCFEADTPCEAGLACVSALVNNTWRGRCVPGTAPQLSDVRVFNVGVMTATAMDPDGDAREVVAELLDARGAIAPHRGNPRLETMLPSSGGGISLRLSVGRGYMFPESAVRARVWLRDGAGLESTRVEVPIEAPTVLAAGAPCVVHTSDPLTHIAECGPGTRCLGGAFTPRCLPQTAPTVSRMAAWFDAVERTLSMDIEAHDPDHDINAAEILYLDAQGQELPGQSFSPYSSHRNIGARREGVYGLDERALPNGTARIRVRVGDSFGLWSPWTELTPTPAALVETGGRCDPGSTARMRCESGVAYCVPRVGDEFGRCEIPDPACPRYWNPARWALPATPGTYSVTGGPTTWSTPRPTCLTSRDRTGAEYEFVAPTAGTYRFVLEGPAGATFYALSLRAACGGPDETNELACRAADGTAGRAEIVRALTLGERVMMVATTTGSGLTYRLSVTVP